MDKHTQLIELYCAVCYHYDSTLINFAQRNSNNFAGQTHEKTSQNKYLMIKYSKGGFANDEVF